MNRSLPALLVLVLAVSGTAHADEDFTLQYRCQGGKSLAVQYHYGEATATARLLIKGKSRTLKYGDQSNEDTTVFTDGTFAWSIDNAKDKRTAVGIALTEETTDVVNGEKMPVSRILYKDCSPRKRT